MEYTRGLSINLRRTSLSESSAARRGVVPSNLEEGTEDYSGSGTAFESAAASEATPNTIQAPPESTDRNELYQNSFMAEVQRFMFINASAFNAITEEVRDPATPTLHHASDLHGDPLPLEYLMGIPIKERRQRLFQLISPGDIVRGHVTLKTPLALGVQVTSFIASDKVRDFLDLDIRGLVHHENLAAEEGRCEGVLKEMELEDVVHAVVIAKLDGHLNLSFLAGHYSQFHSDSLPVTIHLGYQEGERPDTVDQRPNSLPDFLHDLARDEGFLNPCSTNNLKPVLQIAGYTSERKPTLIDAILMSSYSESDYSHSLRKVQRHKWSMDTVAVGVKHFKEGDLDRALKLINHALEIDPYNVEGLVARGALYANRLKYSEGITDFEAALTINHTHKNARKYLVETQVAYGQELEREGKLERAVVCYREALADDPSQAAAKARLDVLRTVLQRKAAEKLERERKEAEEEARIKRLHSIIKEEREKKKKTKGKKKNSAKKSHKKEKKHSKKTSKRRHYSSEEDSESSYLETSSGSTSSPLHRYNKGGRRSHSRSPSPSRQKSKRRSRSRSSSIHSSLISGATLSSKYKRTRSRSSSSSPRQCTQARDRSHSPAQYKRSGRKSRSYSKSLSPRQKKGVRKYDRSRSPQSPSFPDLGSKRTRKLWPPPPQSPSPKRKLNRHSHSRSRSPYQTSRTKTRRK